MNDDPWASWLAFGQAARNYFEAFKSGDGIPAARQFGALLRDQFASATPWRMPPGAFGPPENGLSGIGPAREHQARAQRLMEAWRRMEAAQLRLNKLWQAVLQDAASAFIAQIDTGADPLTSSDGLRSLYEQWIGCAEAAYARTAHGEAFCQAQAEVVNAGSEWRREQQVTIEQWMKHLDLPTRSEVNSLIRQLQDLEQQVRALQLQAAKSPQRKAPSKSAPKRSPAQRSSKSRRRRAPGP